jgi:hypothetical protein
MSCLPVLSVIEYPQGNNFKRDWKMYVMFDYEKDKYFLTGNRLSDKHCYNFYFDCTKSLIDFIQYSMDINNKQACISYEMYAFDKDDHYDFLNYNFYDFEYIFAVRTHELFAYDNEKHNSKKLYKLLHMLDASSYVVKTIEDDYYTD